VPVRPPKKIEKRDGRIVPFDQGKITNAIWKAAQVVGGKDKDRSRLVSDRVTERLAERYGPEGIPQVENIQDIVEETLIECGHAKTARAYILYRDLHNRIRDIRTLVDVNELIGGYLDQTDWRVRENSNMAFSLQGLNIHVSSAMSARYWLNKIYPKEAREAHSRGDLHIHDLYLLAPYCCGWDLQDLLRRGFGGVRGKIESKPAKHFRVALGQLVNFLYTLQGEGAGAQAVSGFDTYLAPFIRYDGLSYEEVKQAMQEFAFNMNVPTRVGFQTPFTNVTLDLEVPNDVKDAFAEVMMAGDAKGRVFTFPIPTYNITKDFDWENSDLDSIWEMTAKYGIPYFSNFVNSDMKPEDARSMCPIAGDEKVLIKSKRGRGLEYATIRNVYEGNAKKNEYEIFSDGKFVGGSFNKFEEQGMLKVILENGHELKMTDKHLNFVLRDKDSEVEELQGSELEQGFYLPYSLKPYHGSGGTYDAGFFVGAFAGDGSFDGETSVVFSLEREHKADLIERLREIAEEKFGAHCTVAPHPETKLVTLKVHSRAAVGLCKDFVVGMKRDKRYRARLFGSSIEFRRGAIEGHYATDGGNRHRIYTSSPRMVECLNMLAATLGTTTSIYKDEREGRLSGEPNYAVLIYQLNREQYGKFWFKRGSKLWLRIKSVEEIPNSTAYCFEVENGEPVFTVGTSGILTHNCRLRLDNRELRRRGGGLFGANPLTGSLGVVTINLPRIGYLAKTEKEFFSRLAEMMEIARESLKIKRRVVEDFTDKGLYPYSRHYLSAVKERFGEYWRNHFNTIGLLGGNEALINFLGKGFEDEEARVFLKEILDFMRERLLDFQTADDQMYNLEATPAEGAAYRLAMKDKELYKNIVVANEKDYQGKGAAPYYTNSTQLPVGFNGDVFDALDIQDPFQTSYTGGTVFHTFLGERMPSKEATKSLVRKIAENYHLPYYTLTPTFSICPEHGYLRGEHRFCPECKKACEVYSRVVGYLRPVSQWNDGKQAEFADRRSFDV